MKDVRNILAILTATPIALFTVQQARTRLALSPESSRKLLHVLMGLILTPLPWLFDRAWPVLLICSIYLALLLGRRFSRFLDNHIADVVYSVRRRSLGEFLFPITVAALFLLAKNRREFYLIPLLILTFADAAAALVGRRYGLCRFTAYGACKSLEGSLAFAAVAFAATHLTLLLAATTGRAESILIALAISITLAVVEAFSSSGLDNILVPLGAWLGLTILTPLSIPLLSAAALGAIILACIAMLAMSPAAANLRRPIPQTRPAPAHLIRISD